MREPLGKVFWTVRNAALLMRGRRRVALASFPRSGNTWLRLLLEEATGEPSGSVYSDRIAPRGREGLVVKTHRLDSHCYTHAIHLVRDPFDAIESYYYWRKDIGGDRSPVWDEHVRQSITEWRAHTQHWLRARCPTYRMRYEDLLEDTVGHLRSVLLWLGYDLPARQIAAAVEASSLDRMRQRHAQLGSRFFRRGQVGKGIDQFTEEQQLLVLDALQDLLVACGYEESQRAW